MTKRSDLLLIAFAAALMLLVAIGRWLSLSSNAWDLGIFTQFSWMLSRGYWSEQASLTGWPVLADHASFILIPISFFYRLFDSPAFLLTLQSVVLAGAALILLPLSSIAGASLKIRRLLLLAYFAQPVLWNTAWFDFHPDAFFPLLVFSFWLQVCKKRFGWAVFYLVLLLVIRETSSLVVAGLALTCFLQGKRIVALLMAVSAIAWAAFLLFFWYPLFFPLGHHNSGNYEHLFSALLAIYRQPHDFSHLIQVSHLTSLSLAPIFLVGLIIPWIFFWSKGSIVWFIGSLVPLIPLTLSANSNQVSIDYHYGIMVAPFFCLAAIDSPSSYWFLKLSSPQARQSILVYISCLTINLIVNLNFSLGWVLVWRNPLPFLGYYKYLSRIPVEVRVMSSNGLSAHLANRPHVDFVARSSVGSFPAGFDMLVLNVTDPGFGASFEKNSRLLHLAAQSGWMCDQINVSHLLIAQCADANSDSMIKK